MKKLSSIDIASNQWDRVDSISEMISIVKTVISKYGLDIEERIDYHKGIWIKVKPRVKTIAVFIFDGDHHHTCRGILELEKDQEPIDAINNNKKVTDNFLDQFRETPRYTSLAMNLIYTKYDGTKSTANAGYYIIVPEQIAYAIKVLKLTDLFDDYDTYLTIGEHLKSILKIKDYDMNRFL